MTPFSSPANNMSCLSDARTQLSPPPTKRALVGGVVGLVQAQARPASPLRQGAVFNDHFHFLFWSGCSFLRLGGIDCMIFRGKGRFSTITFTFCSGRGAPS